ncbi:uncharacterized protein LOC103359603 isoform X2 [Stegastes partitus]|uniref:Uncharacterized protein LOC103359603 isoform X2 n=1 Tax=Stegastes partitus TaxID=144197 RepID=A0A9Y4K654_9TELE|nr:PREDICTED: uncharacterized protein LOC103359603 isoform X2 [Stegastes partitus]
MKLIDLSLILLILASYSDGQDWNITVKDKNEVEPGSDVTILCKFTVPPEENTTDIKVVWKTSGRHNCTDKDNNLDAFVLHWNDECVDDKYRHRTSLVGNAAEGNCSLRILDIRENVPKIYMRVFTKNKGFSFNKQSISISLKANPNDASNLLYMGISVPVTALVVVLLVAGVVFCIRHKRSQSFTREESGYYANFSRASSDPPKRALSDNKDKELPDEPIYINVEEPKCEMDQNIPVTENVYGNVDYTM